jgi:hyperosmotically inducible protein
MKKRNSRINKMILSAAVFSFAMAGSAFAQDSGSPSASESMHQAGQEVRNAGSDTYNAAKDAGTGTVTAMRDTKITAKVKVALHEDKITEDSQIHVDTVAGVVTLTGDVPSTDAAAHAEQIASQTEGVKQVNNQLKVSQAANMD